MYPWHSVTVTWTGKVVPCCRDVNASLVLGDLRRHPLEKVWNDVPIQELRAEFVTRKVTTPLCASCTEASLEVGLPRHYPLASIKKRLADAVRRRSRIRPAE